MKFFNPTTSLPQHFQVRENVCVCVYSICVCVCVCTVCVNVDLGVNTRNQAKLETLTNPCPIVNLHMALHGHNCCFRRAVVWCKISKSKEHMKNLIQKEQAHTFSPLVSQFSVLSYFHTLYFPLVIIVAKAVHSMPDMINTNQANAQTKLIH